MKLVRDLLFLTCLLLFSIIALMINLSFFSDTSIKKSSMQEEVLMNKPIKSFKNQLGKELFKANCAACHNRNMRDDLTGPALGGVRQRWENNDVNLFSFIRNSKVVINSGDEYAKKLFKKWKIEMPPFSNLEDKELDAILNYIDEQYGR